MVKVLLENVAQERRENIKTSKDNFPIVGLEHIAPMQIQLTDWSTDKDNTFTKVFKKGDILFGRRRAYLKKAALAPFDGICSGDITVIAPIAEKIEPTLLPFIIQNDDFFDFAVEKSAGSLSPRVKWEHLKTYSFELPAMEKQRELAQILWAAEETKQSYKSLLQKTDDLVKAKFEEMFGGCDKCALGQLSLIIMGQSPDSDTYNMCEKGLPFYQGKTEFSDKYINPPVMWCTSPTRIAEKDDVLISVRAPVGTVNIATQKCCIGRGLAAIRARQDVSTPLFLFYALKTIEEEIEAKGFGSTFKAITKDIVHNLTIPDVSGRKQKDFVEFAQQAEKSKQKLQKSLEQLNATTKALINENLK